MRMKYFNLLVVTLLAASMLYGCGKSQTKNNESASQQATAQKTSSQTGGQASDSNSTGVSDENPLNLQVVTIPTLAATEYVPTNDEIIASYKRAKVPFDLSNEKVSQIINTELGGKYKVYTGYSETCLPQAFRSSEKGVQGVSNDISYTLSYKGMLKENPIDAAEAKDISLTIAHDYAEYVTPQTLSLSIKKNKKLDPTVSDEAFTVIKALVGEETAKYIVYSKDVSGGDYGTDIKSTDGKSKLNIKRGTYEDRSKGEYSVYYSIRFEADNSLPQNYYYDKGFKSVRSFKYKIGDVFSVFNKDMMELKWESDWGKGQKEFAGVYVEHNNNQLDELPDNSIKTRTDFSFITYDGKVPRVLAPTTEFSFNVTEKDGKASISSFTSEVESCYSYGTQENYNISECLLNLNNRNKVLFGNGFQEIKASDLNNENKEYAFKTTLNLNGIGINANCTIVAKYIDEVNGWLVEEKIEQPLW